MTIAEYILKVLRTQVIVVMSWGFHNAKPIEDGLAFNVQGFKFNGRVEITYDEGWDLFDIRLINEDGSVKEEALGVYIDGIVSTIDNLVEHTSDYKERIKRAYSL